MLASCCSRQLLPTQQRHAIRSTVSRSCSPSSSLRRAFPNGTRPRYTPAPARNIIRCSATSGGGGGGSGAGSGGSGGGRGDGSRGHPMQIWTYLYAAFLAGGGVMAYTKAKSGKSLGAGLSSSVILAICAYQLTGPASSSAAIVACVVALALTAVMGLRYYKSRKVMPAGVAALSSALVAVGYLTTGF